MTESRGCESSWVRGLVAIVLGALAGLGIPAYGIIDPDLTPLPWGLMLVYGPYLAYLGALLGGVTWLAVHDTLARGGKHTRRARRAASLVIGPLVPAALVCVYLLLSDVSDFGVIVGSAAFLGLVGSFAERRYNP